MDIKKQHIVFFSATNSTRSLVKEIANKTGIATYGEYNITQNKNMKQVELDSSDLLIVGVPSYSGRVPSVAVDSINMLKGNNTPAIIVCTYGNRHYDDTLIELRDLVSSNGFTVVSAGAFVTKHSIFPKVAADRPNESDRAETGAFTHYTMKLLKEIKDVDSLPEIGVKGNFPYRKASAIPLRPKGNRKCDKCGICVHLCPTDAIPLSNPKKTDKKKCISCARCIDVCPQNSRAFRGILYKLVSNSFVKKHVDKQPNVTSYVERVRG